MIILAAIITTDAKFGWPSTRIYWVITPETVDTTKQANKNLEYSITRGFVAEDAFNSVARGSISNKQIIAIAKEPMNDKTMDTVK